MKDYANYQFKQRKYTTKSDIASYGFAAGFITAITLFSLLITLF